MPKMNLTQARAAKLVCPPGQRRIEFCDIQIRGLFLEVRSSTGGKTWYLRYTCPDRGTAKTVKLGLLFELNVASARKQAAVLRGSILEGNLPGSDKQKKSPCITFSEFFEGKYVGYCRPRKKSWSDDLKLFSGRLRGRFVSIPLDGITLKPLNVFWGSWQRKDWQPVQYAIMAGY